MDNHSNSNKDLLVIEFKIRNKSFKIPTTLTEEEVIKIKNAITEQMSIIDAQCDKIILEINLLEKKLSKSSFKKQKRVRNNTHFVNRSYKR